MSRLTRLAHAIRTNPLVEAALHPFAAFMKVANLQRPPRGVPVPFRLRGGNRTPRNASEDALFQSLSSVSREENRLSLYATYNEMQRDPLVGQMLTIVAEDATMPDTERGARVWVESKNPEVRRILSNLLANIELDDNAPSIVRSMCAMGDDNEWLPADRERGIIGMTFIPPWDISRRQNEFGQLEGFGPIDPKTGECKPDTDRLIPFYEVANFRLRGASRVNSWGESVLYYARDPWRQLQMMLDQIVLQRLLRRPDRLVYKVNGNAAPYADVEDYVKDLEQSIKNEIYLDASRGIFESEAQITGPQRDMVLPLASPDSVMIENFPATNQNDMLRDFLMMWDRLMASMNFPRGFWGVSEKGVYLNNRNIAKQDAQYAKRSYRIQQSFLTQVVRVCALHLIWLGLDPSKSDNAFRLRMAPVSTILEEELMELHKGRVEIASQYLDLGDKAGFADNRLWKKTVLKEIAHLPAELIDVMFADEKTQTAFEARWTADRLADPEFQADYSAMQGEHPMLLLESDIRRNGSSAWSTRLAPEFVERATVARDRHGVDKLDEAQARKHVNDLTDGEALEKYTSQQQKLREARIRGLAQLAGVTLEK